MNRRYRFLISSAVVVVLLIGQFVFNSVSTQAANAIVYHGNFTTSHQDDFYKIEAKPGEAFSIDLTMAGCNPPPSQPILTDPYLRLWAGSPGGTLVASNDSVKDGSNACSHISWTASVGGTYFVEATTFRFVYGLAVNTTGPYTLTIKDPNATDQAFFGPGDNRMDGRPGDRIVVWCNQPGQVVVYGIVDGMPDYQKGFLLAVFKDQDIVAAGDAGISHDAGSAGVVSISLRKGWLWVAWNGGTYAATGQHDFTKNLDFSQCVPASS